MSLTIKLPIRPDHIDFNLKRWEEVLADPHYTNLDGSFETDRFGQVIHMPPPSFRHARLQSKISTLLDQLTVKAGAVATECPVSTTDGVKGVDVVWLNEKQADKVGDHTCVPFAPAICIEIKSPRNSWAELNEKKALYFEASATEVWICDADANVLFFVNQHDDEPVEHSLVCPDFPREIQI